MIRRGGACGMALLLTIAAAACAPAVSSEAPQPGVRRAFAQVRGIT